VRTHDFDSPRPRARRQFDDDEPRDLKFRGVRRQAVAEADVPDTGDRWSSWEAAEHGPEPIPEWVVTEHAAVDDELGILKTGKEADVHLVRRAVPGTGRSVLLAVKRYRDADHRLFHRDAGYLEGRRVRRSREMRAMENRTSFGRQMIAGQWAAAEFAALSRLWHIGRTMGGIHVPYPVQLLGTELMLEFIGGDDGQAAPRLAQARPEPAELLDLWRQMIEALTVLARCGLAHGDLSPYNILVHEGRLILIDLPQIVDVIANPQGRDFLSRDVRVVSAWFAARGLPAELADPDPLIATLLAEANLR
jgi:RIO kinase 1